MPKKPKRKRKKCLNCKHGQAIRPYKSFPSTSLCDIELAKLKSGDDPRDAINSSWNSCEKWEGK
jgi:hypothetical protein